MRLAGFASSIQKLCVGSRGWSSNEYRPGVMRPGGPSSSNCCRRGLGRKAPNFSRSWSSSLQHPALELWPPLRLSSVADATHSGMGTLQVWRTAGSRLHRLHWCPAPKVNWDGVGGEARSRSGGSGIQSPDPGTTRASTSAAMDEQFPPLQNDLILRVARGEQFFSRVSTSIFIFWTPRCADCKQARRSSGPPSG